MHRRASCSGQYSLERGLAVALSQPQEGGNEQRVLDLLAAADFFSDDGLRAKCDAALAASAARRLKVCGVGRT